MEKIRVFGLTRLNSLELKRQFPDADITFEPATSKDPKHGELATAALIVLALAGIKALAAWLLMDSTKGKIKHTIQVVNSRGESRTEEFEMEVSERTSQADVVKALAKLMKVDPGLLKE